MGKLVALAAVVGCASLVSQTAEAGLLDRIKRKAEEVKTDARVVRNDVDSVTNVDERVESRVESAADQAIPSGTQLENRAAGRVESTEAVRAARGVEHDVNAAATADERAKATVGNEVRATERTVEAAVDIEGRARTELGRTDAAVAVREAERDVQSVLTADEQAERELQRERASLERAISE
jgi:hypothetical protein